ncbi:MAG TPA: cytochrome P450 [Streptosporangiaceae bacterium]|jgi:cytochrome P450
MTTIDHGTSPLQSFPVQRCPFGPPAEYARMRDEAPVVRVRLPDGRVLWVVTRHAEAQRILTDPRISTDTTREDFTSISGGHDNETMAKLHAGMFIDMDPPEHDVYRRMLISEFSVKRIKAMRPGIEATANELIDAMLAGDRPADLVAEFGLPLPSLVICQLLGVPYEERAYFQSRTRQLVNFGSDPEAAIAATEQIRAYLDDLVTRAEGDPGDNLIGRLVTERRATGELSHDALVGMTFLLLIAGHETTANMLPLSVLTLLRNPGQLAELRDDPSLWPGAVEELLRILSITDWAAFDRMAIADIEIGGTTIRAGDGVYVLGLAANWDERAYPKPGDLDIHRRARNHVAFGFGVHQCLGQNLARAELEIALRVLFDRIPDLRAATEDFNFKIGAPIFGLYDLPVTW